MTQDFGNFDVYIYINMFLKLDGYKNCYCFIVYEMYLDWCLHLSVNSVLFDNEPNLRAADLGRVVTRTPAQHLPLSDNSF